MLIWWSFFISHRYWQFFWLNLNLPVLLKYIVYFYKVILKDYSFMIRENDLCCLSSQVYRLLHCFLVLPLLNYSWAIWGKYRVVIDGWLSFPFVTKFHYSCTVLNWIIALETIPAHYFFFLKFCFQCCHDLFTCNFFLAFSFWFSFFLILFFFILHYRQTETSSFHLSVLWFMINLVSFGLAFASAGSLPSSTSLIDV